MEKHIFLCIVLREVSVFVRYAQIYDLNSPLAAKAWRQLMRPDWRMWDVAMWLAFAWGTIDSMRPRASGRFHSATTGLYWMRPPLHHQTQSMNFFCELVGFGRFTYLLFVTQIFHLLRFTKKIHFSSEATRTLRKDHLQENFCDPNAALWVLRGRSLIYRCP